MIVPRMTSATPARLISRVASATSDSNATPMRVPRSAGERNGDERQQHVDARDGGEPRRAEAHERCAGIRRHRDLRLALVAVSDGELAFVRGIDVDAKAERGCGLDGLGATADVAFGRRRAARGTRRR
jgi:hypothetical protein